MKKILSFAFLAIFALVLTGCGSKGDVLTCTGEDGEKMEITFKSDKVTKVAATTVLEDEDTAKAMESLLNIEKVDGLTISRKGKSITMTMSGAMLEEEGEDFTGSKAEVKKELEEEGYKCK